MSNIQTGAELMTNDLSHLGFLADQIGRLITISTTPVIAGDSFEMDAVGALRLSSLRRGFFFCQAEDGIRDSSVMEFRRVLFRSSPRRQRLPAGKPPAPHKCLSPKARPWLLPALSRSRHQSLSTGRLRLIPARPMPRAGRSEERRGGEEGRSRGAPDHLKKKSRTE